MNCKLINCDLKSESPTPTLSFPPDISHPPHSPSRQFPSGFLTQQPCPSEPTNNQQETGCNIFASESPADLGTQHRWFYIISALTVAAISCNGLNHPNVITVIIRPSDEIFTWPEDKNDMARNDYFIVDDDPDQVWNEKKSPVVIVDNNRLLSFYRKVYSKTSSLVLFLDTHHQACPIDLFRERILGYVTTAHFRLIRSCPDLSDVTSAAALSVVVWSFDLSTFMSQFLLSWTDVTSQPSFALLFDKSGREHFLDGNSSLAGEKFVYESTFSVYNCSDPELVVKTAAKTDIRDIVMIGTSRCVSDMIKAVSQLRLPSTRFRWLLYPTDAPPGPNLQLCAGIERFCDQIKPLALVERGKPQDRPTDLEDKLVSFSDRALDLFSEALLTQDGALHCSLNCSKDCFRCQKLFQEGMKQIKGQNYELFPITADAERRNIIFDMYRLGSNGNTQVGNWSAKNGLSLRQQAYPQTFTDTRLTVVVVVEPPFVFRNNTDPDSITYYGYSVDVLREIAIKVGFEYNFAECSPGGYGFLEDSEWTGCIGNVVRGEADVILGALTVTVERDKVMDFTLPYYDFAGIQIMMKREDSSTKLYYYASVFTTPAWLSIFGVLGVTSILLWAFERITQSNRKQESTMVSKESYTNTVALSIISSEELNAGTLNSNENPGTDQTKLDTDSAEKILTSLNDSNGNNEVTINGYNDNDGSTLDPNTLSLSEGNKNNNNTPPNPIQEVMPAEVEGQRASSSENKERSVYSLGDSLWAVIRGAISGVENPIIRDASSTALNFSVYDVSHSVL
ncbi:hypothetical protein RRG08_038459 [Elysia crispata]|uniref:Uncharacterized protein n=1 Tax=Elysia crispata TaxID=231223 RepID=A0AAE0ZYK5_9GAST|nr:hypothetical protein RRG08_038459 [Elysia crispata]